VTITRVYKWDVHQHRIKQVAATAVKDSRRLSSIAWPFLSYHRVCRIVPGSSGCSFYTQFFLQK
ncbi:hypothetical protein MKX03_032661, partial [Papaver bracteatum]